MAVAGPTASAEDVHMRVSGSKVSLLSSKFSRIAVFNVAQLAQCDLVHAGRVRAHPAKALCPVSLTKYRFLLCWVRTVQQIEIRGICAGLAINLQARLCEAGAGFQTVCAVQCQGD
jgi:hypothetical protein